MCKYEEKNLSFPEHSYHYFVIKWILTLMKSHRTSSDFFEMSRVGVTSPISRNQDGWGFIFQTHFNLRGPEICLKNHTYHLLFLLHAVAAASKLLHSCLTLCDPTDGSPPGSSVPGILQARILEWVAISFSTCSMMHLQILLWPPQLNCCKAENQRNLQTF